MAYKDDSSARVYGDSAARVPKPIDAETGEESDIELGKSSAELNYSARGHGTAKSAPVFTNDRAEIETSYFGEDIDNDFDALPPEEDPDAVDETQFDENTADEVGQPDAEADADEHENEERPETPTPAQKRNLTKKVARKPAKRAKKSAQTKSESSDPVVKKKNRRRTLTASVISITTLALMVVLALGVTGRSAFISKTLGSILAPLQSAVSSVTGLVQGKMGAMNDNEQLELNYNAALQELASTNVKIARYDEVVAENERLRALMNNYEKYAQYEPMFARVIGKDTGNWFATFTIDKGTSSGVTNNMTVMSANGVVGRVVEVGLNYAKVTSIIDGSSGVAALIERNRDNGVVRGMIDDSTDEQLLQMNYLPDVNDVRTGDNVLTSGLDGIFPKGLPIGSVTQISRQSSGLSQYVVVTPYADFEHIEEVILLKAQTN